MSTARLPLVGVVTPVYNGEPHIAECIESVIAQSYPNWEYTLVDNCSTDRTREIVAAYASRDSRIRIVESDCFVPVIANHNRAFRQLSASADYCKPVAADDRIFPDCLREMVRIAEQHPQVAIVGAYESQGETVNHNGAALAGECVSGYDVCRSNLLDGPYVFGAPTSVMYRADIVRSREDFYNERNVHADTEVCFEFLRDRDFGFAHQVLTYTRPRANSNSTYTKALNSHLAGWLQVLVDYGGTYLDPEELERRLTRQLDDYHRFLGGELFKSRGRDFWRYHRTRLAELGYPLQPARLAAYAARFAFDRACRHPRQTLSNLAGRLRRA